MPHIKITGFVPKELINIDAVRLELLNALRSEGRAIRQDFKSTTKTWRRKPKFEMKVSLKRGAKAGGYVEVWTDNEIYGYVNHGTGIWSGRGRYPIRPKVRRRWSAGSPGGKGGRFRKAAKALAFPSKSRPKTRPGRLGSGPGGSSGPIVIRKQVMHPGIRPRRFDVAIRKKDEKQGRFQKKLDRAVARGLARANKTST